MKLILIFFQQLPGHLKQVEQVKQFLSTTVRYNHKILLLLLKFIFFKFKNANRPNIRDQVEYLNLNINSYNNSLYRLAELIPEWYTTGINSQVRRLS